jgi:hypothetical protein
VLLHDNAWPHTVAHTAEMCYVVARQCPSTYCCPHCWNVLCCCMTMPVHILLPTLPTCVVLLHDNACPHTVAHTAETFWKIKFDAMVHPLYSPDHLFGPLNSLWTKKWRKLHMCGSLLSQIRSVLRAWGSLCNNAPSELKTKGLFWKIILHKFSNYNGMKLVATLGIISTYLNLEFYTKHHSTCDWQVGRQEIPPTMWSTHTKLSTGSKWSQQAKC